MKDNHKSFYINNKSTGLTVGMACDIAFLVLSFGTFFLAYQWVSNNTADWQPETAAISFSAVSGLIVAFFSLLIIVRAKKLNNNLLKFGISTLIGFTTYQCIMHFAPIPVIYTIAITSVSLVVGFMASFAIDRVFQNSSISFWKTVIVTGVKNLSTMQRAFTAISFVLMVLFGGATYWFSQNVVPEMTESFVAQVDEEQYHTAYQDASTDEKKYLAELKANLDEHLSKKDAIYKEAKALEYDAVHKSKYSTPDRVASWYKSRGWLRLQKDSGIIKYLKDVDAAIDRKEQKIAKYDKDLERKELAYGNYLMRITQDQTYSASITTAKEDEKEARKASVTKWSGIGSHIVLLALIASILLTPIRMVWVKASGVMPKFSARETFSFFEIIGAWIYDSMKDAMIELARDLNVHDRMDDIDNTDYLIEKERHVEPRASNQEQPLIDAVVNFVAPKEQVEVEGFGKVTISADQQTTSSKASPTPSGMSKEQLEILITDLLQSVIELEGRNAHKAAGEVEAQSDSFIQIYLNLINESALDKDVQNFKWRIFEWLNDPDEYENPFHIQKNDNAESFEVQNVQPEREKNESGVQHSDSKAESETEYVNATKLIQNCRNNWRRSNEQKKRGNSNKASELLSRYNTYKKQLEDYGFKVSEKNEHSLEIDKK
ncbi:MAG: hypothetical protein AAF806_19140 [Bacteroidota bacterium]